VALVGYMELVIMSVSKVYGKSELSDWVVHTGLIDYITYLCCSGLTIQRCWAVESVCSGTAMYAKCFTVVCCTVL